MKKDSAYKVGSQPPEGYIAWHEWAAVQDKAKLKQVRCGRCALFKYPQELSDKIDIGEAEIMKMDGPEIIETRSVVCRKCLAKVEGRS